MKLLGFFLKKEMGENDVNCFKLAIFLIFQLSEIVHHKTLTLFVARNNRSPT